MTDVPQADANGLMHIGAVAAHNIAAILNLDEKHVGTIEQAIKDEIGMLSSHFSLAMRDISDQHEMNEAALKKDYETKISGFHWADENRGTIAVVIVTVAVVFFCIGVWTGVYG